MACPIELFVDFLLLLEGGGSCMLKASGSQERIALRLSILEELGLSNVGSGLSNVGSG